MLLAQLVSPHEFVYERPEPAMMVVVIALALAITFLDHFGDRL